MRAKVERPIRWTSGTLLERGWTKTGIKKFLVPCDYCDNPHYKCAAPMALYDPRDVEEAEKRPEVIAFFIKSEKRKLSAKKAVDTKKQKTSDFMQTKIDRLKPPERMTLEELSRRTMRKRREYLESIDKWEAAEFVYRPNSDLSEMTDDDKRQMCNYVRHCLIQNYDNDCWACEGMIGAEWAYRDYKYAVMELIFSVYPELKYDWHY